MHYHFKIKKNINGKIIVDCQMIKHLYCSQRTVPINIRGLVRLETQNERVSKRGMRGFIYHNGLKNEIIMLFDVWVVLITLRISPSVILHK